MGHRASDCRHKKGQNSANNQRKNSQANMMDMDVNLIAVVTDVCMVSHSKGWWIDTGATKHICGDRSLFTTYEETNGSKKLYMGNATASLVGSNLYLSQTSSP